MKNEIEFKFGDYAIIEQKRHGVPNEMFVHKVVGQLRSNTWVDVPVRVPATETLHGEMEDICLCICCGIDETEVRRYRVKDMRRHSPVSLVADEKRGSTITLQAVNELIASLESAGELSIREQKFLKLAKEFRICSASLDAAIKTGNMLADQNAQLAAENVALALENVAMKQIVDTVTNLDNEPQYHAEGMGCGLEDRGITDRYDACRYGWDEAMERIYGEVLPCRPAGRQEKTLPDTPGAWHGGLAILYQRAWDNYCRRPSARLGSAARSQWKGSKSSRMAAGKLLLGKRRG